MYLALTLAAVVVVCFLFSFIARKIKVSSVVALIVAGIFLGLPGIEEFFIAENMGTVSFLAELGLISVMFLAGMELSWGMLYKEKKDASVVALFCFLLPFFLGFAIFYLLGFPFLTALVVGICLGITAEATKAQVLMELKKINTKIGSLMLGAGVIDDTFGIALFAAVAYIFTEKIITTELIILLIAIAAFFAGIVVHRMLHRTLPAVKHGKKILFLFIVPFFFVHMGTNFSFQALAVNPLLVILIVIIAIVGKVLGSILTKPITKMRLKQLYLVGWGMNSRGAIELALAFVAFDLGLIGVDIYSGLILMAIITTIIFPIVATRMITAEPSITD